MKAFIVIVLFILALCCVWQGLVILAGSTGAALTYLLWSFGAAVLVTCAKAVLE